MGRPCWVSVREQRGGIGAAPRMMQSQSGVEGSGEACAEAHEEGLCEQDVGYSLERCLQPVGRDQFLYSSTVKKERRKKITFLPPFFRPYCTDATLLHARPSSIFVPCRDVPRTPSCPTMPSSWAFPFPMAWLHAQPASTPHPATVAPTPGATSTPSTSVSGAATPAAAPAGSVEYGNGRGPRVPSLTGVALPLPRVPAPLGVTSTVATSTSGDGALTSAASAASAGGVDGGVTSTVATSTDGVASVGGTDASG